MLAMHRRDTLRHAANPRRATSRIRPGTRRGHGLHLGRDRHRADRLRAPSSDRYRSARGDRRRARRRGRRLRRDVLRGDRRPESIVAAIQSGNTKDIEAAIRPISETLVSATPFIFVGLGLAVSFRAGLINLGADGQFLIGTLAAAITAALVAGSLPPFLTLVVSLLGGTLGGAAYGFIPGFLKARTGAHEVITTLMLNGIAPNLAFLIAGSIAFSGPPRRSPPCRASSTWRRSGSTTASSSPSRWPPSCPTSCSGPLAVSSSERPASTVTSRVGQACGREGPRCWRCRYPGGWSAWVARSSASGPPGAFRRATVRLGVRRYRPHPARRLATQRCRGRCPVLRRAHDRSEEHGHRDRHPARPARRDRRLRDHIRGGARSDPLDLAARVDIPIGWLMERARSGRCGGLWRSNHDPPGRHDDVVRDRGDLDAGLSWPEAALRAAGAIEGLRHCEERPRRLRARERR